jgi:hypothetical protein
MKIIKKTATELVMQNPPSPEGMTFGVTWVVLSLVIPVMIYVVKALDTVTIACDRIEPTIVNCEVSYSKLIPFLAPPPVSVSRVQQAMVNSATREDSDGDDYQVYWISLVAPQSRDITEPQRGRRWHDSLAAELNTQLNSDNQSWEIHRNHAPLLVFMIPVPLLFIAIGLLIILIASTDHTLTLDKSRDQLTDNLRRLWRLDNHHRQYKLSDLDIKLHEYEDDYGKQRFKLELKVGHQELFSDKSIRASTTKSLRNLYQEICQFLSISLDDLPSLSEENAAALLPEYLLPFSEEHTTALSQGQSPSLEITASAREIYQGEMATFSSATLTALPNSERQPMQNAIAELQTLGFEWLGDLQMSRFTKSRFYGLANSSQLTYAIAVYGNRFYVDFYTVFPDCTSLTTTWMPGRLANRTRHNRGQQSYRYQYTDISLAEVFRHHRQHMAELRQTHGKPQPARANLVDLAMAIDEFLIRDFSGWKKLLLWLF